jgi:(1->4)-alpha-D-glucan 1-alpha-D-glucosylmutase
VIAPTSTYRLQITAEFDLFEASRRLSYLHDLGVDWVYLSPLLTAEPGSAHGYDVVGFEQVDESRGGPAGLAALSAEARRLSMGVLVDIVPNHVGVATPAENSWWWDVLKHGPQSVHAKTFDIDWDFGAGRLRLPILADEDVPVDDGPVGHLDVVDGDLCYRGLRLPLAPGTSTHEEQHYELVSWRRADDELNYRRFFAVSSLAGVRVEDPAVFAATHQEIGRWFDDGLVDGLRIDHPDGLRDPRGYLDDLAELTGNAYVLVEKILEGDEELPSTWATAGTTGYDVLALIDRVLTDPAGETPLTDLQTRLRGAPLDWQQEVHGRKRAVATGILRSETRRIVRELPSQPSATPEQLEDAVAELLASFDVYRTYLPDGRRHLDLALDRARDTRPDLRPVLTGIAPILADPGAPAALRLQQTSGMVMAKAVEDCAFYRTSRLTSLNEVGGEPDHFAVSPTDFHEAMTTRQATRPHAMTTLTTHDTKRGEDARARISVLSEMPATWAQGLDDLLRLAPLPDPAFGSLLWQAVLGAWPCSMYGEAPPDLRPRLHAYAEKAMREAGQHTSWTDPDAAYEQAVHAAVDAAFDDARTRAVLADLLDRVVQHGWSNGLAAKLVAITAPGVCDVYQGSELWEQSLVDPDNRRAVDFDRRQVLLAGLDASSPLRPRSADDGGAAKLFVTRTALRLRRDRPDLFAGYAPLPATGRAEVHALAFDRGGAITVCTRLPVGLQELGGWADTTLRLPSGRWHNVLGSSTDSLGGEIAMKDLLADLPVAVLVKDS